jgi:hypothetical protein
MEILMDGLIGTYHKIAWTVVELVTVLMMDDLRIPHQTP